MIFVFVFAFVFVFVFVFVFIIVFVFVFDGVVADLLGGQMRDELGDEPAVPLGLQLAMLLRLLDR